VTRILLVDTNLLILLVLGRTSTNHIERFHRTRQFTVADYLLLLEIMDAYDGLIVTPHILTETSNLLGQLGDPLRANCRATLAQMVPLWQEHHTSASMLVQEAVYLRLGLTDSAVVQLARDNVTVLTDDLDLYRATTAEGRDSINFTHRRAQQGLL